MSLGTPRSLKLRRTTRSLPPETIVSLIDVVFFLLVFFMLVGRLDATAPFELTPPEARHGQDMPGGGTTIAVAADGALALDGSPMAWDDVRLRIAERDNDPDHFVRLNGDAATPLSRVLPLVADLEEMGVARVVLVVTPEAP